MRRAWPGAGKREVDAPSQRPAQGRCYAFRMNRRRPRLELRLPIWIPAGDYYIAIRSELEAAIRAGGLPESTIAVRMGHGYPLLASALQGVRLSQYEAAHVEHGIREWPELTKPNSTQSGPLERV